MADTLLAAMRYLGATIENYLPDGGEFIRGLNFDDPLRRVIGRG